MNISICISTYNGQLFFDEQINSVLNQTFRNFNIIIRDDGSTDDGFIEQLKEYEKKYKQVQVYLERNVGVTLSYYELLKKCQIDSDFIVFADQDDVWDPKRLENTVKYVENNNSNSPLMCLCRLEYVDENLNYISTSPRYKNIGFKNALVQNLASGCTICINNPALRMLLMYTPKNSIIHDWWMYLVVAATGQVIQEPNVSIKYRQHRFNVLGGTTYTLKKNQKRIKRKLNRMIYKVYDQVQEFYNSYFNIISEENRSIIETFLKTKKNLASKIQFIIDFNTVRREKFSENILLKIVILFSRTDKK